MEPDVNIIKEWKSGLDKHIILDFHQGDDAAGKRLKSFCDFLERNAGTISVHTHRLMEGDYSHLRINQEIRYYAVPEDRELLPFLDLLSGKAVSHVSKENADQALLVDIPCAIDIFIGTHCPFCPEAVKKIAPFAVLNPKITVRVIDGMEYPELAEKFDIKSVPTVCSCDGFRWTGTIPVNELLSSMITRKASSLGAASLESMIADGKASDIARMMMESNEIFPAFIEVLLHEKWPVRLGAMVAAETLCESRPDLASELVKPLSEKFFQVDDSVKGDIIQVMGETRNRAAADFLAGIENSDLSEEIKDMARETKDMLIS